MIAGPFAKSRWVSGKKVLEQSLEAWRDANLPLGKGCDGMGSGYFNSL
jgi:hypothetical protein